MAARRIIFDTDPGVDDATALLILNASPDIELVGITTVFGNADIDDVTRNALYLKERFGIAAPVARGAGASLGGQPSKPPVHVHGHNGLGDVAMPDRIATEPDARPAWQFIVDEVRARPNEITLLAVGRMTNLALALQHEPGIAGLVRDVVIMGGAFALAGHNGNVTPVAEANIIGDPLAADIVFGAPWPVTAVGLDVTRRTIITRADLRRLSESGRPAAQLVAEMSEQYAAYHDRFGIDAFYLHDGSAAAYCIDPSLFVTRQGPVRVVTEGVATGQTIQNDGLIPYPPNPWDDRPSQAVCIDVKADDVRRLVLDLLLA